MMLVNEETPDLIELFIAKKYRHIKSFATTTSYDNNIKCFYQFLADGKGLNITQTIELIKQKKIDPILLLDDFFTYLRTTSYGKKQKSYSNSTIRSYLTTIKEFLRFLGFKIYNEDIKQIFKLPPKQENSEPGQTRNHSASAEKLPSKTPGGNSHVLLQWNPRRRACTIKGRRH